MLHACNEHTHSIDFVYLTIFTLIKCTLNQPERYVWLGLLGMFCVTYCLCTLCCFMYNFHLQVTLEEVNSQIALEYGQAMTVRVLKADCEVMRKCPRPFCLCVTLYVKPNEMPSSLSHSGGAECHCPGSKESYQEVHGAETTTWRRSEMCQLVNTCTHPDTKMI